MNISPTIMAVKISVMEAAIAESKKDAPDTKRHAKLMNLLERLAKLEQVSAKLEKEIKALSL